MTEQEILNWLNHNSTKLHTTKSIAAHFHVTPRTVQNYIRVIKEEYSEYLEITRNGIRVKKTIPLAAADVIPSTYKDRKNYILRKLLVSETSVDMDWLAARLCISEITLQNEIKRIRKSLEKSNLTLKTKNNQLFITGDVEDKKALIIEQIYGEAKRSLVSLDTLSDIFPNYDVREIRDMILEKLREKQFYIDEYSLINLLLHILIAMDQSYAACRLEPIAGDLQFIDLNRHFVTIVREICSVLEKTYHLTFTDSNKYQFNLLLMTRAIRNKEFKSLDDSTFSVSVENMQLVNEILSRVYDTYSIDLQDMEFVIAFSIHVQNMLIRLREKVTIYNPLLHNIKMTSPFIYDIGVYISNIIKKRCNVDIYEDEIAYIALHVGARIEELNRIKGKLRAILVCPQYYSYYNKQFDKLRSCFQDEMIIESIVTNPSELEEEEADLIISTIPISVSTECVVISNFFSLEDQDAVSTMIQKIKLRQRREKTEAILRKLIRRDLFEAGAVYSSRQEAICLLGQRMIDGGLVSEEFIDKLLEREQISPSNFEEIAIPHPIDYYAKESVIQVVLLKEPVSWGSSQVQIIFMLAVSKQDLADYSDIFSLLAGICGSRDNLERLLGCEDYDSFMDMLLTLR